MTVYLACYDYEEVRLSHSRIFTSKKAAEEYCLSRGYGWDVREYVLDTSVSG